MKALLALAIAAFVLGGVAGFALTRVEADGLPPARLAWSVDAGRSLASSTLGIAGAVPFRFVEALCAADGRSALLFESRLGTRFYSIVGKIAPADAPDRGTVVAGITNDEFRGLDYSAFTGSCG